MSKKVFISYSHNDEKFKKSLVEHLASLKRNGVISVWNDRKILPSQKWGSEIDKNLEQSEIILFLISSSFLSSEYCYEIEAKKALEMHKDGKAALIPIIVRACNWNETPLGQIQALPKDAKPIKKWKDQDEGWLDVVKGLRELILAFEPISNALPELKERSELKITDNHNLWLEDTEVVFTHRMVDRIKVSDIYTWPDLKLMTDISQKGLDYINSSNLLNHTGHHFVFGEEQQGKTALLKYLFQCFICDGMTPLYLDAQTINKTDLRSFISKALSLQYISVEYDGFMAGNSKVLLIDNFDKIGLNSKFQIKLLEQINTIFDYVVLTAHESYSLVYSENYELNNYEAYELLGFGHQKREEVVVKWVSLGIEESIEELELYSSCDHLKKQLNTILQKNIVPSKPVYVLLLLQMFEAYANQNLELTSYGHCYQHLIYSSFDKANIKKNEIDKYLNVLTEIAWKIFINRKEMDQKALQDFFINYEKQFLPVDKNEVVEKLTSHSILTDTHGVIKFKYPYIYYFFVGKKISDSYIDSELIQSEVDSLLDKLHREDAANILIFITHHTKNAWVLKKIKKVLSHLFEEQGVASLTNNQLSFMSEFIKAIPELVIEKRVIQKERENHNNRLDQIERDDGTEENDDFDSLETLANLNKTFKGMEVAGQIIRNRHANLTRDDLLSLADNSASAGLRCLDYFIEISSIAKLEIIKIIEKRLENTPSLTDKELQRYAESAYLYLTYGVISGIIRKIASSIGSKEAIVIYEELEKTKNTPAFSLIKLSIELQHKRLLNISSVESLKKDFLNNPVCMRILKEMVVQYIYMFPVHYKTQQQLASILGISVQGQQKMNRKRLGKG